MKKSLTSIIKIIGLTLLVSCYLTIGGGVAFAARNAPGVYVTPTNSQSSDIIMTDWSGMDTTPYTYWAVHNWNQGGEAGGYAGFQQQSGKRTVHFSIWDPISTNEAIKAEYLDSESISERFGGEGTGRKVSTTYPWQPNQWYTMLLRSWNEHSHTKVGQWVKDSDNNWKQIAILDFPVANINFKYGQTMFQEDWAGTGQHKRSFKLKNGYGRSLKEKRWVSWDTQKVENQHRNDQNWNGGATNDYFWAQAGGFENSTIGKGKTYKINQPSEPKINDILIDSFNVKHTKNEFSVDWKLKSTSTPQFKATIKVNRNGKTLKIIDSIQSYKNSVTDKFSINAGDQIQLTITDIFDQKKDFYYSEKVPEKNSYEIVLKGLGDKVFSKINLSLNSNTAVIDTALGKPHTYFSDKYAGITINDRNGVEKYNHEYIGNKNYSAKQDKVTMNIGDYITLYHREYKNRLMIEDTDTKLHLSTNETITYQVKENGIEEADSASTPQPNPNKGSHFQYTLKGLGDKVFSKISLSLNEHTAVIDTTSGKPHTYFSDKYAGITINDRNGIEKYNHEYIGNKNYSAKQDKVAMNIGDYITLYHREYKDRLMIENIDTKAHLSTNETITYQVKENGIEEADSASIPQPNPNNGSHFQYTLKGLGDKVFSKISLSLNERTAVIDTTSGKPHTYFSDKYAGITINDRNGIEKYNHEYIGNKNYSAKQDKVAMNIGDYITLYHREYKDRLMIENIDTKAHLSTNETITYQVKENGIEEADSASIPQPNPNNGSHFQYTLKGLGDKVFSKISLSLNERTAVIDTTSGQPHTYFSDKYAGIIIRNRMGFEKYDNEYIGNKFYVAKQDKITLNIGDYVTLYHREYKDRLMIENTDVKKLLPTSETITYQVTENGLEY